MASKADLPHFRRFITTHNAEGKTVFSTDFPEEPDWHDAAGAERFLAHTTNTVPATLQASADLESYAYYRENPPGLAIDGGNVLCIVDFPPKYTSVMHRTVSLDYGIVLEGSVSAILDSGDVKNLRKGDILVQRSTLHSWRNDDSQKWARMMFVLQSCNIIEHDGQKLETFFESDGNRV